MTLQLVCINYGNFVDACKVVNHCVRLFPRFDKAVILHPECTYGGENFYFCHDLQIDLGIEVQFIIANSKTQNECCLYEMPQYITCDHAIGIQWDGFIVNPDAWTDEFLEYDYIAPPWPLTNIVNPEWRVGSGGAMLFSKKMANLWGALCAPHPAPNDWEMGAVKRHWFEEAGMKYAPLELAMRFGEEIPLDDQRPLGYTPFTMHGFQYGDHEKYRKLIYG